MTFSRRAATAFNASATPSVEAAPVTFEGKDVTAMGKEELRGMAKLGKSARAERDKDKSVAKTFGEAVIEAHRED